MDLALTVLAFLAGGLILEVYTAARAPLSYQDERGYQPGSEAAQCAEACPGARPN